MAKDPGPLERDIQAACLEYLQRYLGDDVWRQNQGGIPLPEGGFRKFNGKRGISDIIGILPDGRWLAVEVKRPGKDGTDEQWEFLDRVNDRGGVGCLVHSVDELMEDMRTTGVIPWNPAVGESRRRASAT